MLIEECLSRCGSLYLDGLAMEGTAVKGAGAAGGLFV